MRYLIFYIILLVCNCYTAKPKLCINCKNFIKHNIGDEYGKCKAAYYVENNNNFLITGINYDIEIQYHYCSTARSSNFLCGENGKKYIE